MRKIIATAFVSLDGVMQAPGGPTEDPSDGFDLGGWTVKYSDEKSGGAVLRMVGTLAKPNDVLLGRKTYDIWANFWPHAPADSPLAPVFTKANKYVMTTGTGTFPWANSHQLRSIDELKKVKAGNGPDIVLWGSSTLYSQLLEANLIDRLLLLTFPLTLGKGKRLFGSTTHPVAMKLLASEVNSTGVIIATYEPPVAPKFWNA
ncbi:MAG TPA: dihydrofolate reductase family protein [Vicinamibacterales bacterium]|nr:dihydrofolate reductase family protein [Vicinamibacterales bacterium]